MMLNLQQDSFQGHDLLLRVDAEDLKVCVGGQLPDGSDQVAALLRSLLAFAGQEQAASGHRLKEKKSFEIFPFLLFSKSSHIHSLTDGAAKIIFCLQFFSYHLMLRLGFEPTSVSRVAPTRHH